MAMKLMRTPRSMDLDITSRCNLRCSYCSHFLSAGDVDQDLPTRVWLAFFEELGSLAVLRVCLSGGEPFLRQDLELLIEGIVRNRMRFTILTNGTLITEDRAAFIARTGRCDAIQVSIDGATAASHEACRGLGSLEMALKGLHILKQYGIPTTVRVTIHRHNVDELEEIARLLLVDLAMPQFSTNAASPMGLCRKNGASVQLNHEEMQHAMETLVMLNRRYNGRIHASAGPLAYARTWKEMEEARRQGLKHPGGRGYLSACNGVMTRIAVRADGAIVPCTLLNHIELGRINEHTLKEVWQDHPELSRMRKRRQAPLSDFPFCAGCEYIPYCRGGCPAIAYGRENDESLPAPDGCYRRFLEQGGRLVL